jgi:CHASE2 domain-containing sensor protein
MTSTADTFKPDDPDDHIRTVVLPVEDDEEDTTDAAQPDQTEQGVVKALGGFSWYLRRAYAWLQQSTLGRRFLTNTDWMVGFTITLLLVGFSGTPLLRSVEWGGYDLGVWAAPDRPANKDVVIVGIDEDSLTSIGAWPWPRDELAAVNGRISDGGAKVIGYLPSFDYPDNRRALQVMQWLQAQTKSRFSANENRLLERAERRLETDRSLAASFGKSGAVVLAVAQHAAASPPRTVEPLPSRLEAEAIRIRTDQSVGVASLPPYLEPDQPSFIDSLQLPVQVIRNSAAGFGVAPPRMGAEQAVRNVPLGYRYGGVQLPAFPLAVVAKALGVNVQSIQLEWQNQLAIGSRTVPVDTALRAYPVFYKGDNGRSPFRIHSFKDIKEGRFPDDAFRGKIVLVGFTSGTLERPVDSPLGEPLMPVVATAHVVSSLLNGDLVRIPEWQNLARIAAFAFVGLYLMFLLPRLGFGIGLLLTGLFLIVLLNLQLFVMIVESIWLPLMVPALALVLGHFVLSAKQSLGRRFETYENALSDAYFELGASYESQGLLDKAFRNLRRCRVTQPVRELLYNLGLDFERKRQYAKAAEAFRQIADTHPDYRDVADRITRNEEMVNAYFLHANDRRSGNGNLIVTSDSVEKPMLGRYRVEKVIGKGAMGVVYLGRDPKIGRVVAIKTLNLGAEFDDDDLLEVKDRFLREAETAGRLDHPNIVTIYDVGEEQDLAYIAMDYLEGKPLHTFTKPDNLLPMEHVLILGIQVAEALAAAHAENVVHRDIKPANIIYDRRKGLAKVTDFGVACLTDTSKTKTGTILGTPSFMSPEQLEGRKISGRSDIFSFGVTLYQLLTGELPFEADSLSSLMYKITYEKHKDIRVANPELPTCVGDIIDRCLAKDPDKRYETGKTLSESLRRCLQQLSSGPGV